MIYRAVWQGQVIAESDRTVRVEGNHYFPSKSLRMEYFTPSDTTSRCPWKGQAQYYTVTVDGRTNRDAAWYYPNPTAAAKQIRGHVAFWRGVRVEQARDERDGSPAASWWQRLTAKLRE